MFLLMSFISKALQPILSQLCSVSLYAVVLYYNPRVIVLQDNILNYFEESSVCTVFVQRFCTFKNTVWSCKINIFKDAECRRISFRSLYNVQCLDIISRYFHNLSRKDLPIVPWKRNIEKLEMSRSWMIILKYKQESTDRKKCF